jgi:ADP-ribose pyrophosphatase YjhB (NUDIX family)
MNNFESQGKKEEKTMTHREEVPFAPQEEPTYGLKILKETWTDSNGKETIYWKYGLPDSVQIFALTKDNKVIGIHEFQPGVGSSYSHIPGETMEQGEKVLEAAGRGLTEETGYRAGKLEELSAILENSGRSDRLIHIVLATDCEKVGEGEKEVKLELETIPDFWKKLMTHFREEGKLGGGNTLKAAVLALHKIGYLKEPKSI